MPGMIDTPNTLTSGAWAADFIDPECLMPGGAKLDVVQFFAQDSVLVTATATAAAAATSITVSALTAAIPSGTLLDFGGAGAKPAKTTAAAAAGATTLTVAALLAQVNSGDTARYAGDGTKKKVVLSGTVIGRTLAERDANTGYGPYTVTDDEGPFLVPFEILDAVRNNDVELLKPGTGFAIYENRLPEWTVLNTPANEVQTVTIAGTLSAGTFTFYDSRLGKYSSPLAYNGNLAAIQTALDSVYGASNTVAAGASIASFTVTFAVAQAGISQVPIQVQPSGVTGLTGVTVAQTTLGGKAILNKLRTAFRCNTAVN